MQIKCNFLRPWSPHLNFECLNLRVGLRGFSDLSLERDAFLILCTFTGLCYCTMSLRVFNIARRACLLASSRRNPVTKSRFRPELLSRNASFYNADVAGLTDEEAEVLHLYFQPLSKV